MSVLSDQFTNEQIPLGKLGKFIPMFISGWDPARSTLLEELRHSYKQWTSEYLTKLILKHYRDEHTIVGITSINLQVVTVDRWLVGYGKYLPPHQLFIPAINIPQESVDFPDNIIQHGFLYTGPRLIENSPIIHVTDFNYAGFYSHSLLTNFSLEKTDEEIAEFLGKPTEEIYRLYMRNELT